MRIIERLRKIHKIKQYVFVAKVRLPYMSAFYQVIDIIGGKETYVVLGTNNITEAVRICDNLRLRHMKGILPEKEKDIKLIRSFYTIVY